MQLKEGDKLMSLAEAAKVLGCSSTSIYDYAKHGVNGRRLDTTRVGNRKKTTLAAINRFIGNEPEQQPEGCGNNLFGLWDEARNEHSKTD